MFTKVDCVKTSFTYLNTLDLAQRYMKMHIFKNLHIICIQMFDCDRKTMLYQIYSFLKSYQSLIEKVDSFQPSKSCLS